MFISLLIYLILMVLAGTAAVLLTSKKLAERFVTAGILPRQLLGIIPAFQIVIKVLGIVLIAAGITKIAIDTGWLNEKVISQYALPACLILLGAIMLLLNRRQ